MQKRGIFLSAANPSRPSGARRAHRGNDLAAIHILAAECGLIKPARDGFPKDETDYRALVLTRSNGVTDSAKSLDFTQRAPLIEHLRVLKRSLRVAGGKRERVALSPMQKKCLRCRKPLNQPARFARASGVACARTLSGKRVFGRSNGVIRSIALT